LKVLMSKWDLGLVERAFGEAALDPVAWVKALDTATAVSGSFGSILLPVKGDQLPNVPFTESLSKTTESYFCDGWHLRDERQLGLGVLVKRGVIDDLDILSEQSIKKHPYYQEFLAPHGLRWFAGVKVHCGNDLWCLSIQRTFDQGPFSKAEKQRLAQLSNALSTSAALARAMSGATANGALEAFELSSTGVVLINRMGEVFKANRTAERLLTGDVTIIKRRLTAKDKAATEKLDRALYELMWRRVGAALSPPVALTRDGRRPLLAYPAKLAAMTANALADCQAVVILVDPDDARVPPLDTLRVAFGLSEAESRLAAQLASGQALETAADQSGIAKETSRTQLKSIFAKTGVHRQAELVALLAPLLGKVKSDPGD